MKIAVISDIHSNKYALKKTLDYLLDKEIDLYIFLGDYFGYYPWALETFNLLKKYFSKSIHIIGNHDSLILLDEPKEHLEYWDVIKQNKLDLNGEALEWLSKLKKTDTVTIDNLCFKLYHGTPDNCLLGRFYPDNEVEYDWFPNPNEVILLGHTHYPLLKEFKNGGVVINPGSVGQSREGDINASFCIFDTDNKSTNFVKLDFNVNRVIKELEDINWYPRAIQSLRKNIL